MVEVNQLISTVSRVIVHLKSKFNFLFRRWNEAMIVTGIAV